MKMISSIAAFQKKRSKMLIISKQNKKGITFTLKEMAYLAFAAIIIWATFSLFNNLYAATLSKPDDGSIANLNELYSKVKELIDSKSSNDYRIINYFFGKDKFLVGFDSQWDDNKKVVKFTFSSNNIYRPYKCGISACICLYSGSSDWDKSKKRDDEVIECRSEGLSDKKVVFLSGEMLNIGIKKGNDNYMVFDGSHFNVQRLYIEKKFDKNTNTYNLYISAINENGDNDQANIRKKSIDSAQILN